MGKAYSLFGSKLEQVKQYDNYIAGVCPFHDDTKPSLLVYDDGWFVCLACNHRGHHTSLMNKLNGTQERRPDYTALAERGLPLIPDAWSDREQFAWDAHEFLVDVGSVGWYLKVRGIEDRIEPNMIGWDNGWYVFPVLSEEGYFNGMILRASASVEKNTGHRYIIPRGQKPRIYVPDWNRVRRANELFVVYGMIDALVLADLGFPVVTTAGGKDSFDPEWLSEYRQMIYIIPDLGEEQSAFSLAKELGWRGKVVRLNYPDGMKDPADFAQAGKTQMLLNQLSQYRS